MASHYFLFESSCCFFKFRFPSAVSGDKSDAMQQTDASVLCILSCVLIFLRLFLFRRGSRLQSLAKHSRWSCEFSLSCLSLQMRFTANWKKLLNEKQIFWKHIQCHSRCICGNVTKREIQGTPRCACCEFYLFSFTPGFSCTQF